MVEDFHNMDCGIAGGWPHPASAHDEGMCLDGPFDEDVEPLLGYSTAELQSMPIEEYVLIREQLLNGMHSIDSVRKVTAFSNPGVYVNG